MNKLALLPIAALWTAALPVRAASSCDGVIAAAIKVLEVPAHLYMTETAGVNGGKTKNAETIYLNGVTYVNVNGRWLKSPISPKELEEGKKESEQKNGMCSVVRDEAVNGEPATLYKVHNQTPDDTVDTQIWISKSKGLPLRQIDDIDAGGGARGKSHTEIRYEYTNVTAPAVTDLKRK
jgi:hypothetical protein